LNFIEVKRGGATKSFGKKMTDVEILNAHDLHRQRKRQKKENEALTG